MDLIFFFLCTPGTTLRAKKQNGVHQARLQLAPLPATIGLQILLGGFLGRGGGRACGGVLGVVLGLVVGGGGGVCACGFAA